MSTAASAQRFPALLETATMLTLGPPLRSLSLHIPKVLLVQSAFSWYCRW
jgi:hypothetical protein